MPIYVFTEDHKATTISHIIETVDSYNEKYRNLDDSITWRVQIQKPTEGTDIIPFAAFSGTTTQPLEVLGLKNPAVFSDDEFTDFGNYYRVIDSFDENVNFRVRDINQSEKVFKEFFEKNPEYSDIVFESDEIKYRLASGTVGIQHATNEVIEKGELPMLGAVYIVMISLVFTTN